MLMIKTGRRRKARKNKRQRDRQLRANADSDIDIDNEDNDAEFDPDKPDELSDEDDGAANGQIEDIFRDAEMDEESECEVNVERQLNFGAEISMLINYDVVSRYMKIVD